MLERISNWLGGSERRTKRAGAQLSAILLVLTAMGPPRKQGFILLTLRQRQPHLAFLLRYVGLEDEATAVERLDWTEGEEQTSRTSGLVARRRFEKAYKVFSQASDAANGIVKNKEIKKTKTEGVAAAAAFAEATLSIKHSWRTQAKFWKGVEAGGLEELTEEEKVASDPAFEALRDAAIQVTFLIRMTGEVKQDSSKAKVNGEIQAAFAEQVAWILSPPVDDDTNQ